MEKINIAVLLSGNGTTLQNLIDRIDEGIIPAKIILVLSSKEDSYGLQRAKNAGIDAFAVSKKKFVSSTQFNDALYKYIYSYPIDLIILAGFMSIFRIDKKFQNKVLNVHPALIPAFCGKGFYGEKVHRSVIESGVKITGCTVHFADDVYDHGPIILQKPVNVLDNDTPDTLAHRVQEQERIALVQAVKLFAEGRLTIEGKKVKISPE
jgi:phosphoribosylglycinamide formyltransferase 1